MNDYVIDLTLLFNEDPAYVGINGPSSFCYRHYGELVLSDEARKVKEKIGTFAATVVNAEASLIEGNSLVYLFDHDASLFEYFEDLFDPKDELFKMRVEKAVNDSCLLSRNLLIIDDLVVYPEHRGQGVGLVALRALMERLGIGASVVAIKAIPSQFNDGCRDDVAARTRLGLDRFGMSQSKATSKLREHFSRLGFTRLRGNDIMVRSLEVPLPPVESLLTTA
jgi:GNAT superfamily N-acetyltransferase